MTLLCWAMPVTQRVVPAFAVWITWYQATPTMCQCQCLWRYSDQIISIIKSCFGNVHHVAENHGKWVCGQCFWEVRSSHATNMMVWTLTQIWMRNYNPERYGIKLFLILKPKRLHHWCLGRICISIAHEIMNVIACLCVCIGLLFTVNDAKINCTCFD